MGTDFTEQELFLLYKLCYGRRFCDRHLQEHSLISGVPKDKIHLYKKALHRLTKWGIVHKYKTQKRHDYCFPPKNYTPSIEVLKKYESQYEFIDVDVLR